MKLQSGMQSQGLVSKEVWPLEQEAMHMHLRVVQVIRLGTMQQIVLLWLLLSSRGDVSPHVQLLMCSAPSQHVVLWVLQRV